MGFFTKDREPETFQEAVAYVILVQCWERQADDMMTGFGRPVNYLMARTTYNMVLANVQLFKKAEEYRNRIQEKYDQATQKYLDSTVDS